MAVLLFRLLTVSPSAPFRVHSSRERQLQRTHLEANPTCAACGSQTRVRVHHVVPVSVDPTRALDATNFLSLCESYAAGVNCHLFFGHGGDWRSWNRNAVADAFNFRAATRIYRV